MELELDELELELDELEPFELVDEESLPFPESLPFEESDAELDLSALPDRESVR